MERVRRLSAHLFPSLELAPTGSSSSKPMSSPKIVCVTGAAGQIAYSLLPLVASGKMLGPDQPVVLHLLDIEPAMGTLNGVVMELEDCAYPLLQRVVATADPAVAFNGCDYALLVGAFPRGPGMERKDLLAKNAGIFEAQGRAINEFASRDCKIVVVGNPANTNCLLARHFAPSIPAVNFSCLTRLDHNRAKAQIAKRLGVRAQDVQNVCIWGNHSATQYPDVNNATVVVDGVKRPVREAIGDDAYLNTDFITCVQQRGAAVIAARKLSSAFSAANAIVEHMRDWILGTPEGDFVSMGVVSDGSYGIPEGLIYSFPVRCKNGQYEIVQGLNVDEFSRSKMTATQQELESEKETAFSVLHVQ